MEGYDRDCGSDDECGDEYDDDDEGKRRWMSRCMVMMIAMMTRSRLRRCG